MKGKPNLSAFNRSDKERDGFLENAISDRSEKSVAAPSPYVLKSFRLSWDVVSALKLHVAQKSIETATRVTETEIIEKLLRSYLKIGI